MAVLDHPSIVRLYDFFEDDKNFYLVMDFCNDGSLLNYVVKNGKLAEPVAAFIYQQICSAVRYCHERKLAHRDLKLENVLIEKLPKIKVADFGLCGFVDPDILMSTFCGSPAYCAPECLARMAYDGPKSDMWSLGVILFSMVTGSHPWNCDNQSVMMRQILGAEYTIPGYVSADCKDLIGKLLRLTPDERLTADQVLEHQWLKLASKAQFGNKPAPPVSMPRPHANLTPIAGVSGMHRSPSIDGRIESPFGVLPTVMTPLSQVAGFDKNLRRRSLPNAVQMMQRSVGETINE
jgi:serine/threonine protein kinase